MKNSLLRSLRHIAAKVLHNTRGVPQNLQKSDKFELMGVAYGAAAVEEDFRLWCQEQASKPPRYPITDYLKVVDERLGVKTDEPQADMNDPRVKTLSAAIYDLTGFTPSRKTIATLLVQYSESEILEAVKEYETTLDDKDIKKSMHHFFASGGAEIVIYARKHRQVS